MSIEKVREYFSQYGIEDRILEFETSSETVELAAIAVGCEGKQITKTMSFLVDEKPILIATAGDARIANAKFNKADTITRRRIPMAWQVKSVTYCRGIAVYMSSTMVSI